MSRQREPRSRFITANRLTHHLLEWRPDGPVVLLLHGFLEHAHAWDFVAPRLAAAGFRAMALDWRGHGDSEWVGAGGYYHFADYAADLAGVVRALGGRAALVGHSMGANAALQYAGAEPERVSHLACIDALGPPDMGDETAPRRFADWIAQLERLAERPARGLTLDAATARLAERFPRFSAGVAAHMARHGTRAAGPVRAWKFDPLHQTLSPYPYTTRRARAFWERVRCPVLYVEGAETPFRLSEADLAERLTALRAVRHTLSEVGHHPHLECPERLADLLIGFLRRTPCEA
ncbi:MAG TPA: alpha/beta hydrolase [Candidatus Limnocylindria bacterium]|nr:alpha/beta hydrolase [Candidatus Limnocylindria bacterium]